MTWRRRALTAAILCTPTFARAQVHSGPAGSKQLSPAAVAESLKVIEKLNREIAKSPENGALWYRRGMIAWALAARDNVPPPIRGLDWTLLGHMADTSLRKAAQLAPDKVQYKLAAGRYLAASFGPLNRTAASIQTNQAVARVRTIADPQLHADAALQAGNLYFRFYDTKEFKSLEPDINPAINEGLNPGSGGVTPPTADEVAKLLNRSIKTTDFSGEYFYLRAEALFEEAGKELPASGDVFHAKAMLYSARDRWTELTALGRMRIRDAAWDPWGWMALALGTYRQRDPYTAAASFDSAMVRFDTASMHRIDRIERILRPADSARFARLKPDERFATTRLYWLNADPLWSVPGNEPRLEFLARLAFSEFRWTSTEMGELGADTDRGRIYTRYGPPTTSLSMTMQPSGEQMVTWMYSSVGSVAFRGYDALQFRSPADIDALREMSPVQWSNINPVRVDSMPAQVARFRATADSIDVVVAQSAPVAELKRSSEITGAPKASMWILRGGTVVAVSDTAPIGDSGMSSFTHRLANGNYVYRAEASATGATSATRSSGVITTESDSASAFSLTGFGMSDVLLGERSELRAATSRRWSDYSVSASAGVVQRTGELTLLWENYELGADNGISKYTVAITVERQRSAAGKIAAGVVRGIAGTVGVNQLTDRTEITFDRTVPSNATIVDNLALSLGDTPGGNYKLIVKVTDLVTQRAISWTGSLTLAK